MPFRTLLVLDWYPRILSRSCSLNKRERTSLAERPNDAPKKRGLLVGERKNSVGALPSLPPRSLLGTCLGEGEEASGVKS